MKGVIPNTLMNEIAEHLRQGVKDGEGGFANARADEDTVTGDLGGCLRTKSGWVNGTYDGKKCRWRVQYTKFRGRGKGAEEKQLGADWIIEIEVEDMTTGDMIRKGLLAQSKMEGKSIDPSQCEKMEELTPGNSMVFEYGEDGYYSEPSSEALKNKGKHRKNRPNRSRLGESLAGDFLECRTGQRDLYYDAVRKILVTPKNNNTVTRLDVAQRLSIDIQTNVE